MKKNRLWAGDPLSLPILIPALLLLILAGCQKALDNASTSRPNSIELSIAKPAKMLKDFNQVNLVGNDNTHQPNRVDPFLVNAWGIAFSSGGVAWISAEGTGVSTVYNKDGGQQLAPVSIPSPGATTGGHPTGMVFNSSTDFKLPNGNPARFIFDAVDGVISGWNSGSLAIKKVDRSGHSVYTGLAIGNDAGNNFLYAADFANAKIDVFDKDWALVNKPFTDPNLPAGYAPFNIQSLGGKLYVMYAKVGPDGRDVAQQGAGYVDVYNTDGSLDKRLISKGQLNAPWGVAIAPASFFADDAVTGPRLLVGNFGDGTINAFTMDGEWLGVLRAHGEPIVIEGLWAISFAPATATSVNPNWLYFAAGPEDEANGLFGYITK